MSAVDLGSGGDLDALELETGLTSVTPPLSGRECVHGGAVEEDQLWTYYRADGAVLALVRAQADAAAGRPPTWTSGLPAKHVVRTFDYDSVGRCLSSDDPDTDNPADGDETTNSWRYLFQPGGRPGGGA